MAIIKNNKKLSPKVPAESQTDVQSKYETNLTGLSISTEPLR